MNASLVSRKAELLKRDIFDTRYDAAGTKIWLPTGLKIRKAYLDHCRRLFEEAGFVEYMFPSIVAKEQIEKVFTNIKDFSRGVIPISKQAYLSPTGEAIIYPMVKIWLEDGKKPPFRIFQINNLFRSRKPRGLLRDNQEDTFIEAHTIHASREEAEHQHLENIKFIDLLLFQMALPVIKSVRPLFGNNPVAEEVIGYDAWLPFGEALQVASTYKQMQTFSKAFEIRHDGELTYHTTFGFSSKMLIAALFGYLEQSTFVLPFSIAPVAVAICPVIRQADPDKVIAHAQGVRRMCMLDDDLRGKVCVFPTSTQFSANIEKLDQLGIPLVIEVSDHELANNTYTLTDRLDRTKEVLTSENVISSIKEKALKQTNQIMAKTSTQFNNNVQETMSVDELAEIVKEGRVAFCALENSPQALKLLQEHTVGEALGFSSADNAERPCLVSGRPVSTRAWVSRRV